MKPELSYKNPYWIHKFRYYELKYYCRQYPMWKKAYDELDGLSKRPMNLTSVKNGDISDPTAKTALAKEFYYNKMKIIEQAAIEADEELYSYILEGVTEGRSYDVMNAKEQIPCCRDVYYDRCRRFFYILSQFKD